MAAPIGSLTNAQLEILKMFDREVPDSVILEMRRVFARHLVDKADTEMDRLFEEKGWGDEKIEEWKNDHYRTPYNPK